MDLQQEIKKLLEKLQNPKQSELDSIKTEYEVVRSKLLRELDDWNHAPHSDANEPKDTVIALRINLQEALEKLQNK